MNIKRKIKHGFNALAKRSHWYNEVLFPDCRKFWRYQTFNTDVVNLGSTSGLYAFNYEGLPLKGANWALSHNPLSGDNAILRNYFSFLNPRKSVVIMPLCPFSGLSGRYDFVEDRYYTLLNPLSIPGFSYQRQRRVKNWKEHPARLFPVYGLWMELRNLFTRKERPFTESQMEKDADTWMKGWMHEFSLSDFSAPLSLLNRDSRQDAADILNEMIGFCKERDIRPVLVVPPMYHTLAERFTPEARQLLLDGLLDLLKDKSVRFLNYMDDKRFSHNRTLFRNAFLLNETGAKQFTRIVLSDLGLLS